MPQLSNNPNSPRQKMINLMYLVFIAMMALNVSSEVLDGFELVEAVYELRSTTHPNEIRLYRASWIPTIRLTLPR